MIRDHRLTCRSGPTAQNRARSSNDTGWVFRFPHSACTLGEMVRCHGARRARYRGLGKVLLQGLITAIVVNIKRVLGLLAAQTGRAELAGST